MNNTKAFAKIVLTAIGIFYIIKIVPLTIRSIAIVINAHSWKPLWSFLVGLLIPLIAILFLWYFFFHLRDRLADKIIKSTAACDSTESFPWFPAVLRLVCFFAGTYCLFRVPTLLAVTAQVFAQYARYHRMNFTWFVSSTLFQLPVMLIAGIYLVCGAPHFVRWQVRKTIEQCKKIEGSA